MKKLEHDVKIEGPHPDDEFLIMGLEDQGRMYGVPGTKNFIPDRWLDDGDKIELDGIYFDVSDLTKGIFPREKMKEIDTITQNLQATYVSKLISITNLKKYDEVAQSAAFGELLKIQKLLRRQSSNDEPRNHKNRLSLQIDKKLTA